MKDPSPLAFEGALRRSRIQWHFSCADCGVNVDAIGEYYVVHDRVWELEAMLDPREGMYCVGCLEHRLGRVLCPRDFEDVPVNQVSYWRKSGRYPSIRLFNRITGKFGK